MSLLHHDRAADTKKQKNTSDPFLRKENNTLNNKQNITMRVALLLGLAALTEGAVVINQLTLTERSTILSTMNTLRAQYGAKALVWEPSLLVPESDVTKDNVLPTCRIESMTTDVTTAAGQVSFGHMYNTQDAQKWPAGDKPSISYAFNAKVADPTRNQLAYDRWRARDDDKNPPFIINNMMNTLWRSATQVACMKCDGEDPDNSMVAGEMYAGYKCIFNAKRDLDFSVENLGAKGDPIDQCFKVVCPDKTCFQPNAQCDAQNGQCNYLQVAGSTSCTTSQGGQGICTAGVCVAPSLCTDVVCVAKTQCHLVGKCDEATGICSEPEKTSANTVDLSCNDGNDHTLNDECDGFGGCYGINPCTSRGDSCLTSSSSQCTMSECDINSGECVRTNKPDGTDCDDGNSLTNPGSPDKCVAGKCTGEQVCMSGTCHAQGAKCLESYNCDPLTNSCVPVYMPEDTPCDDGDLHSIGDKCTKDGACIGEPVCNTQDCPAPQNKCYTVICYNGQCIELKKSHTDQDDDCITCDGVDCAAMKGDTPCKLAGVCQDATGKCTYADAPEGSVCDDKLDNTVNDKCVMGFCVGEDKCKDVTCTAKSDCHSVGVCDKFTGTCSNPVKMPLAMCNDGDDTTSDDMCLADGTCTGTPICRTMNNANCVTDLPCKKATCINGECIIENRAVDTVCDDGNANTFDDKCLRGECVGTDRCANVNCDLPQDVQCATTQGCDSATGECKYTLLDGTPCDDKNAKTSPDTCVAGQCVGKNKCDGVECPARTPCHLEGECDATTGTCSDHYRPMGSPCNDTSQPLMKYTKCDLDHNCVGVPLCTDVVCVKLSQCHEMGECDANNGLCTDAFSPVTQTCDDGNNMTMNDMCDGQGTCRGENLCANVDCTDTQTSCTIAECNMQTGVCEAVALEPNGTPCTSYGAICMLGKCTDLCLNVTCPLGQCHVSNTCNRATGECVPEFAPVDTPCNDGLASTSPDTCNNGVCTGEDLCAGVVCEPDQCHSAGVCNPGLAIAPELCTKPILADGTVCDDGDADTIQDACVQGECIGRTCAVSVEERYGDATCTFKLAAGPPGSGGFGLTPEGNLYVDGGCIGIFKIHYTGETVVCTPDGTDYAECQLITPVLNAVCLPTVPVCQVCDSPPTCFEEGVCNPKTGLCVNPPLPDGSVCDDGNDQTDGDKCEQGVCIGTELPPGCFVASKYTPSRECEHQDAACSWASGVWPTMEECCRPGNGHSKGCAPEPTPTGKCFRPGKWWPTRDCVEDASACDWTMGTDVWPTQEECCEAGNGFDCGCSKPPPPLTCWENAVLSSSSTPSPVRSCREVNVTGVTKCSDRDNLYDSEAVCCKQVHGSCSMSCKSLDVVLVIDGSGSMKKSFTKHSHGFYALTEMLADWVKDLPLSNTAAGEKPEAGVRVGIVQFSSKYGTTRPYYKYGRTPHVSYAKTTTSNMRGTTGGMLSGKESELLKDIAWHEDQFIAQGTMVRRGLEMASNMFEDNSRPRAVIIISDGEIHDVPDTKTIFNKLDAQDVVVFGVVVRRFNTHNSIDTKAEQKLRPILSRPVEDHFFNLEIDDIPEKVLHGCCDPNSRWGNYIKSYQGGAQVNRTITKTGNFVPVPGSATGQANIFFLGKEVKPFVELTCDQLHQNNTCDKSCDTVVDSVSINIEDGYVKKSDVLACPACKKMGLRVSFQRSTGVLYLKGRGKTLAQMTEALSEVVFVTKANTCSDRSFTFAFGDGFCSSKKKGHRYAYYAQRGISWDDARKACEAKEVLGQKGYLITVTDKQEQSAARNKICGKGWMGASDMEEEGKFKWVTGPEACSGPSCPAATFDLADWTKTGKGTHQGVIGTPLDYTNWARNQPDDYHGSCAGSCKKAGEDFVHFYYPSGKWNDLPMDFKKIDGYVCEWGGLTPSCLVNDYGTRTLECKKDSYIPPSPCTPKPVVPISKSGCASGWVAATADVTRDWCNENCVDSNGKLSKTCKPGGKGADAEKCSCLPARVQQCRCDDSSMTMQGDYCASLKPNAGGLHQCSAASEEVQGDWTEVVSDQGGMPPAIGGDSDDSFTCFVYDRAAGTWGASSVGQCRDAQWQYFTRYIFETMDIGACKKMCEEKEQCHSISHEVNSVDPARCHINAVPIGTCGAGTTRCKAPGTKPKGSATCGCQTYKRGAKPSHKQVCVEEINGKNVCTRPSATGACSKPSDPANTNKLCSRNPAIVTKVPTGVSITLFLQIVAAAGGVSTQSVKITHSCPVDACTLTQYATLPPPTSPLPPIPLGLPDNSTTSVARTTPMRRSASSASRYATHRYHLATHNIQTDQLHQLAARPFRQRA